MAGPGSTWSGPLMSGTQKDPAINPGSSAVTPANVGMAVLSQVLNFTSAGTVIFSLPASSIPLRVEAAPLATSAAGALTVSTLGTTVATIGTIAGTANTWTSGTISNANPSVWATTGQLAQAVLTGSTAATQVVLEYIQQVNLLASAP